jgi:hypothetical protein
MAPAVVLKGKPAPDQSSAAVALNTVIAVRLTFTVVSDASPSMAAARRLQVRAQMENAAAIRVILALALSSAPAAPSTATAARAIPIAARGASRNMVPAGLKALPRPLRTRHQLQQA